MKAILGVFLVFLLGLGAENALAQINDINSAINKAGRQRMLSQRMAKVLLELEDAQRAGTSTATPLQLSLIHI